MTRAGRGPGPEPASIMTRQSQGRVGTDRPHSWQIQSRWLGGQEASPECALSYHSVSTGGEEVPLAPRSWALTFGHSQWLVPHQASSCPQLPGAAQGLQHLFAGKTGGATFPLVSRRRPGSPTAPHKSRLATKLCTVSAAHLKRDLGGAAESQ